MHYKKYSIVYLMKGIWYYKYGYIFISSVKVRQIELRISKYDMLK